MYRVSSIVNARVIQCIVFLAFASVVAHIVHGFQIKALTQRVDYMIEELTSMDRYSRDDVII